MYLVVPRTLVCVALYCTMMSKDSELLVEFFIISQDHAALASGNVLYRVKAEDGHICQAAYFVPFVFSTQSMGRILNYD